MDVRVLEGYTAHNCQHLSHQEQVIGLMASTYRYSHLKCLWVEDMFALILCGFGVERSQELFCKLHLRHIGLPLSGFLQLLQPLY